MLVLRVTMVEGRTDEQRAALMHRLSECAARHFDKPLEEVRLVIYEIPKTHWGVGGRSLAEREGTSHGTER
ncbi:MAG: 4-oxalocrotonate tautomerase [Roseiflexus castenholzii]|uniref:tautomerase family protein n=1 Tax=Roseiflexus castenholzii TaxID=120962 RepID=UPI000CCB23DF|nr:MAG: 4-oxalocrotonate tautomerase [Roseiflexus castenholzii]